MYSQWPPDSGPDRPPPGSPLNPDSDQYAALVACWPCDEGSGRLLQERVSHLHAGLVTSGTDAFAWKSSSDFGPSPAMTANGSTINYWAFSNHRSLDLPRFTIACRVQLNSKDNFGGVFQARASGQAGFQLVSEESGSTAWTPHLVAANAAGTEVANRKGPVAYALPMAQAHSFVWTWDGAAARLWADGVEQTLAAGASGWGSGGGFNIGKGFLNVQGPLADLRIYSAARPELGPLYHDPATRWDLYRPTRRARVVALAAPSTFGIAATLDPASPAASLAASAPAPASLALAASAGPASLASSLTASAPAPASLSFAPTLDEASIAASFTAAAPAPAGFLLTMTGDAGALSATFTAASPTSAGFTLFMTADASPAASFTAMAPAGSGLDLAVATGDATPSAALVASGPASAALTLAGTLDAALSATFTAAAPAGSALALAGASEASLSANFVTGGPAPSTLALSAPLADATATVVVVASGPRVGYTEFASTGTRRGPDPGRSSGARRGPDPGRSSGARRGPDPGRSTGKAR